MNFDYSIMEMIQSLYLIFGNISDIFFLICTFLGEDVFIILLVSIMYWCMDKKFGEYAIITLISSLGINGLIKDVVGRVRPFMNPKYSNLRYLKIKNILVNTEELADSHSFPSGHSQASATLFTILTLKFKKVGVTIAGIITVLLVMMSRVYLGVHYPTDVIGGMILGIISGFIMYKLFDKYYEKKIIIFAVALLISSIALFFSPCADTIKVLGFGIGALVGMILEKKFLKPVQHTEKKNNICRLFIGLFLLMIVKTGLKLIFPALIIFNLIRYAVLGVMAIYLIPLLFNRLKI